MSGPAGARVRAPSDEHDWGAGRTSGSRVALENTRLYRNLEQRESKIRALFDANIIGIFIGSVDGEVIEANDAFLHLLGYNRMDLASGRIHRANVVPPDWSDRNAQALAEIWTRGTVEAFEKEYLRKDGSRVPVLMGATLFERDRIVAFVLDLTDRQRVPAEAHESGERSREMQIQLEHANRLATMGQLTASIAHEILHPIATARNNARAATRFLERNPPDLAEVGEALNCVVRDAGRARDIVDRIRDHMKRGPPRRELFDLGEAINEVVVMVRNTLDKNRIVVRTRLVEQSSSVRGDRVQLQQVVLNLILNAVEAMVSVEGARELSIETEQSETGGVRVGVRDSGAGLNREHLEWVFQPFYTTRTAGLAWAWRSADPSSTPMAAGSGRTTMNLGARSFSSRCPEAPRLMNCPEAAFWTGGPHEGIARDRRRLSRTSENVERNSLM